MKVGPNVVGVLESNINMVLLTPKKWVYEWFYRIGLYLCPTHSFAMPVVEAIHTWNQSQQ